MKNSQKARATTPGSLNDLQDKMRAAVNQKYNQDPTINTDALYPFDIIPDVPVVTGKTIIENYKDDKYYITPFTVNNQK